MEYALLEGTSHGQLTISFNSFRWEVAEHIVKDFGFQLTRLNSVFTKPEKIRHFDYAHEFRVFCNKERNGKRSKPI